MNTKKNLSLCCGAFALLALLPLASRAAETTSAAKEQKSDLQTYVLFTGTDIKILHEGSLYRVRGVEGRSFIIWVKDKEVRIPMGTNPERIKVAQVQTLTERAATVTNFEHDRSYSSANNPYRNMMTTEALQSQAAQTVDNLRGSPKSVQQYDPVTGLTTDRRTGKELGMGPNQWADASASVRRIEGTEGPNMNPNNYYGTELTDELAKQLFDALDVQFEVSSPKPIHSSYVVITATYHEKDDAKYTRNWLFAKAIGPIDSTPQKVSVHEAGFPLGFVVDKLQVHLYEKGVEIATDLSENRAPLTRDEAHEYLVIDYVNLHKNATVPPRLALSKVPDDWAAHLRDESVRKTYYAKVDKTGHAEGFFEDQTCTTKVSDSYCEGVLKNILFLPALEKGKAVDGIAQVKLGETSM